MKSFFPPILFSMPVLGWKAGLWLLPLLRSLSDPISRSIQGGDWIVWKLSLPLCSTRQQACTLLSLCLTFLISKTGLKITGLGGLQVWSQFGLHGEFKPSPSFQTTWSGASEMDQWVKHLVPSPTTWVDPKTHTVEENPSSCKLPAHFHTCAMTCGCPYVFKQTENK